MNISVQNNNISFQSKIKFVSSKDFDSNHFSHIIFCKPSTAPLESSFKKYRSLQTYEVRTCTAGGIVDNEGVLGFHIYDCRDNVQKVIENLLEMVKKLNKDNISALVLGAKDIPNSRHSVPLCDAVTDNVSKLLKPSVFRTHTNKFAQTNLGYNKAADTWLIDTSIPKIPMLPFAERKSVTTLKELLGSFEKITIAPQDRLFVGGKEITKDICPEIF